MGGDETTAIDAAAERAVLARFDQVDDVTIVSEEIGTVGRHRRRTAARARARARDRPVRGAAVRRGAARRGWAFTRRRSGNPRAMPPTGARSIHIGCSGWNYTSWRDEFYEGKPARLWLQHYAQHFDTVEVNNTFYRLPLKSSVAGWVAQTPPDFLFSIKPSRYLTHIKRLTDLRAGVARYYERVEPLVRSPKLGPVLWQLPATFKRDDERLTAALEAFPPGRHCFEFRHASWFVEPVYDVLR